MPVKFIQKSLLALLFFFIGLTTLSTTTYAQTFTAGPGIDQFTPLPKTLSRVGERLSVRVTFNETVMVKGRPTIPFSIGNGTRQLRYQGRLGRGKSLLFTYRVQPEDINSGAVSLATVLGEVIALPPSVSIRSPQGIDATAAKFADGRTFIVLGALYEPLGTVSKVALNEVLTSELPKFAKGTVWPGYVIPTYTPATHDVQLFKVAYRSVIPERSNQSTTAYGLVAIPLPNTNEGPGMIAYRPLVSYQHGTVMQKHEVPSYAFTPGPHYDNAYETRLNVAQFAGQGYSVIAADYFGMGDSKEPEAYSVKRSEQQACLDLYRSSLGLLKAQQVVVSDLFLAGWSQGGLVTMAFLEKLEAEQIKVRAASTASAPASTLAALSALVYNPRDGKDGNTADAAWINIVFILSAFSQENYLTIPGLARDFFKPEYYETYLNIYERNYDIDTLIIRPGCISVGGSPCTPTDAREIFQSKYLQKSFFSDAEYVKVMSEANGDEWVFSTQIKMFYGQQDEAFTKGVTTLPATSQAIFNPGYIQSIEVAKGTHRGTFLSSVQAQKEWFDACVRDTSSMGCLAQ